MLFALVRAFASDRYTVPLPPGHPFPMGKYAAVRDALVADGTLAPQAIADPGMLSREELLAAHDEAWVDAVLTHTVGAEMSKRIGLPVDEALSRRARAAAAGTLAAARAALADGVACNLAGGTHHAGLARGAGFCVFNDLAVTARLLLSERLVARVAIVDLDVHQGDGTAEILGGDRRVFTFSMHGARNYPRVKIAGTLDIDLEDGTGDARFLEELERHLPAILEGFAPDLVLYQSGVDPLRGDRFGRLALTLDGLARRDRTVLEACIARRIPIATVMGGGYARDPAHTVIAHANTVREAAAAARRSKICKNESW